MAVNDSIRAGLLARRRVQLLAWASLIGIVACFVILVLTEQQSPERGDEVRAALIVCLVGYVGSLIYLRVKKCPACAQPFAGVAHRLGAYQTMTVDACQHCGAALK